MRYLPVLCLALSFALVSLSVRTIDDGSSVCWVERGDGSCLMTKRDWARMLLDQRFESFQGGTGEDYRP